MWIAVNVSWFAGPQRLQTRLLSPTIESRGTLRGATFRLPEGTGAAQSARLAWHAPVCQALRICARHGDLDGTRKNRDYNGRLPAVLAVDQD